MAISQMSIDKSYGLLVFIAQIRLASTITDLIVFSSGHFVFIFASQQRLLE